MTAAILATHAHNHAALHRHAADHVLLLHATHVLLQYATHAHQAVATNRTIEELTCDYVDEGNLPRRFHLHEI